MNAKCFFFSILHAAPSKPTRDANDNEEISTHHGVTHQTSSSSGHHSGPSDKHKHHSRKPSGGDGVGDGSGGSGATPEVVGVAGGSSEPDAATAAAVSTKDSFSSGAAVAAAATTTATTTNLHSTSSSIDDVFSPLRGQTLVVGGRTSSQADSSALSPSNNTLGTPFSLGLDLPYYNVRLYETQKVQTYFTEVENIDIGLPNVRATLNVHTKPTQR